MSSGMAQGFLGIDPAKAAEKAGAEAVADIERLYTRASSTSSGKLCDDCLDFDEERRVGASATWCARTAGWSRKAIPS